MNLKSIGTRKLHADRAFTLIEVTLALGVAVFCLTTVFGLLPVGLTSNQASLEQTMAGNISSGIVSDLRCPPVSGLTPRFGFLIPTPVTSGNGSPIGANALHTIYFASNGSVTSVGSAGSSAPVFRATVGFGAPLQRNATPVRVLISWPALSNSNAQGWPTNYAGSYEVDTTLDCN